MMASIQSVSSKGELSFEIRLKRPFPPMLPTLANATTPLFVKREAEALTDPFNQVTTVIGSGPFAYVPEERIDGHRVVYRRNPYALPRSEPPDGMAGGKLAKVDRVEWITMPDAGVAVSALRNGEVGVLENAPYDLLPVIEADPALAVSIIDPLGQQAIVRFNQLIPPFEDPKVRQAALLAVDRAEYLAATVGQPRFESDCAIFFICGTVSESSAGSGAYRRPDLAAAKRLLASSSYS